MLPVGDCTKTILLRSMPLRVSAIEISVEGLASVSEKRTLTAAALASLNSVSGLLRTPPLTILRVRAERKIC